MGVRRHEPGTVGIPYAIILKGDPTEFPIFFAGFLFLFGASGVGNASTFQMISAIMRKEITQLRPDQSDTELVKPSEKESAAILARSRRRVAWISEVGVGMPLGAAVHELTVGAIGTMILAVMTRATLGHTGNALTATRMINPGLCRGGCIALAPARGRVRSRAGDATPRRVGEFLVWRVWHLPVAAQPASAWHASGHLTSGSIGRSAPDRSRNALPQFRILRYTERLSIGASPVAGAKPMVCRQIEYQDLNEIVALLTSGFHHQRSKEFWQQAVSRLTAHDTPAGVPKYGYLLQSGEALVGVILLIFTLVRTGEAGAEFVRCNLSSWFVEEPFRIYASLLISRALRHRDVTYFNLTAVPHTFAILEAQGFRRYCEGRFMALPLLASGPAGTTVATVAANGCAGEDLSPAEADILQSHAGFGCISLVCRSSGKAYPFVFAPRRKFGIGALALLAYCRDVADFERFAGPIGRHLLLKHGLMMVAVDANGPIGGLAGYYSENKPKYFLGPNPPRSGDTAYSERTMFGS